MSDLIYKAHDIEAKSFEIIESELSGVDLSPLEAPFIKRVIHTSADFEYLKLLSFNNNAIQAGIDALKSGRATIYCDTTMALSGINKHALTELGAQALCFVADEDVVAASKRSGNTRAHESLNKSLQLQEPVIYAIGNAPTALLRLCELIDERQLHPSLVIGVPVGFVNVVESKKELKKRKVPSIIVEGRKGGSTISAALINAFLYGITRGEL